MANSTVYYTLIDNFDKLDLSYMSTEEQLAAGGYASTVYPFRFDLPPQGSQLHLDNYKFLEVDELMHADDWYTPVYTFWGEDQMWWGTDVYMPDMYRYILGRRFYISKDGRLKYPSYPGQQQSPSDTYGPHYIDEALIGNNSLTNIFNIGNDIYLNSQRYLNTLNSIEFYYNKGSILGSPNYIAHQGTIQPYLTELGANEVFTIPYISPEIFRNQLVYFMHDDGEEFDDTIFFAPLVQTKLYSGEDDDWALDNAGILDLAFDYDWKSPSKVASIDPLFVDSTGEPRGALIDIVEKLTMFQPAAIEQRTVHSYLATSLPTAQSAITAMSDNNNDGIIDINYSDNVTYSPQYNFYNEQMETKLLQEGIWEHYLPNLYTYYFANTVETPYYKSLATYDKEPYINTSDLTVAKYYNMASHDIQETDDNDFWQNAADVAANGISVGSKHRRIIFEDIADLKIANSYSHLFPANNKISINNIQDNVIKEGGNFFSKLTENNPNKKLFVGNFLTFLANYFSTSGEFESSVHRFALQNGKAGKDRSALALTTLQVMKLEDLFVTTEEVDAEPIGFGGEEYQKYFNNYQTVRYGFGAPWYPINSIQEGWDNENASGWWMWSGIAGTSKHDTAWEYFESRKLNTEQVMYEGTLCHSEVLAYEIVKYRVSSMGDKTHVQSIFFPNDNDYDKKSIEYIDTQVLHNQTYIYEVFTHSLVVGSKYGYWWNFTGVPSTSEKITTGAPEYLDPEHWSDFVLEGKQTFNRGDPWNVPLPLIVRAPYYNNESLGITQKVAPKIIDKPPLPPELNFYPYKDKSDKILILLGTIYGERMEFPVEVFPSDKAKIEEYKNTYIVDSEGKIPYKTDDVGSGKYILYRTTKKPSSWADFPETAHKILSHEQGMGYEEYLEPNVDYYYFARIEDVHGNLSNPTNVFYIRIVKEGGFPPYLINEYYNFSAAKKQPIYEKEFKKYLMIKLNDGVRRLVDEGVYGVSVNYAQIEQLKAFSDKGLKTYKVRLTSKKTGKKIDINLDFAREYVATEYTSNPIINWLPPDVQPIFVDPGDLPLI